MLKASTRGVACFERPSTGVSPQGRARAIALLWPCHDVVMDFRWANSEDMQIGHLRERYLWGPAVDQILAEEEVDGGTADLIQWTLRDHLNTVRDIARFDPQTGTTTVVNHLVYDAFGKVTAETNPAVDSLFLFTARPFDEDTQLQNNLNRWYDSRVGRWLSEDPVGFPGGMNLYEYVGGNPLVHADPDGLAAPFKVCLAIVKALKGKTCNQLFSFCCHLGRSPDFGANSMKVCMVLYDAVCPSGNEQLTNAVLRAACERIFGT